MRKIGLVIPTRWDSERLPGKVLIDINGKPNLQRIIERALNSKYIKTIILAISEENGKEIINWYEKYNKNITFLDKKLFTYTGSHDNIFKRTLNASIFYDIDIIIDTSHCCSLFDPFIADILIDKLLEYNADYSSNVITRSFPDGFDIQVYTRKIYEKVYMEGLHWNQYWTGWNIFHCREELDIKPRIINWQVGSKYYYPEWRLTLDTIEDLKLINEIYKHFEGINFQYAEVIDFIKQNKNLLEINKNIKSTRLK